MSKTTCIPAITVICVCNNSLPITQCPGSFIGTPTRVGSQASSDLPVVNPGHVGWTTPTAETQEKTKWKGANSGWWSSPELASCHESVSLKK